jgi:hypothetical protein
VNFFETMVETRDAGAGVDAETVWDALQRNHSRASCLLNNE